MLVQNEYLKCLTVTDNLERTHSQDMSNPQNDRPLGQHSQARSKITVDRIIKLKTEMDHLGKGN